MTEHEPTLGELAVELRGRFKGQDDLLTEIRTQVLRTNGRVTTLEQKVRDGEVLAAERERVAAERRRELKEEAEKRAEKLALAAHEQHGQFSRKEVLIGKGMIVAVLASSVLTATHVI